VVEVEALSKCTAVHIKQLVDQAGLQAANIALQDPETFADRHEVAYLETLKASGINPTEVRAYVRDKPFLHLKGVIDTTNLPDTPIKWLPVPEVFATVAARAAVVLLGRICGMETVSYGSENDGALFVNLVTLEGEGRQPEKSRGPMKGHTDAASFPFRGTINPEYPRLAPSPDVVYLAAFRNPDEVATTVMSLECALNELEERHKAILKGDCIVIKSQQSFARGIQGQLKKALTLDGTNVLHESPEGTWVRYTHSNSLLKDEDDADAAEAKVRFEKACAACAVSVSLEPGDLLLVNNRKALHGRAPVGDQVGGTTRWLLRSYGLDTAGLDDARRHGAPRHKLFP